MPANSNQNPPMAAGRAPLIGIDARTFDYSDSVSRGIGHYALHHMLAVGQLRIPVENTNIIQAEESAFKYVIALRILAVHPPGEVQHQLVKNAFQETYVAFAAIVLFILVI